MYRFLRYSLLALILLTVTLISALTAMRMAIHGREVEVPKLVGLSPEEAEQQALENGLLIEIENRYYSATIAAGRILSQSPDAGTKVRRGWRVRLTQSLGPQRVAIPNVVGQSLRSAELNLRRSGLELTEVATVMLPGLPPDQVVSQNPQAGAAGVASPKVALVVTPPAALPEYVMPKVVGSSLSDATRALEKAGIKVRQAQPTPALPDFVPASSKTPNLSIPNDAAAVVPRTEQARGSGIVISQTPAPGTRLSSGSAVELQVR